jgi:AraC-like DNA-binding protein
MSTNNRRNEKKANTLFIKLICFTALITMLSVIFAGMFPYVYLYNEMDEDIKQFNNQKLQKLKDTIEIDLFDMTLLFLSDFVNSSSIYDIISTMENTDGKVNAYSVIQLRTLLSLKITASSYPFNDILLYHEKDKKIISAKMGIQDLNDKSLKMRNNDEWIKYIDDLSPHKTIKWLDNLEVPDFSSNNFRSTLKCISIIIRLNPKLQSGSLVYICITIPEAEIKQLMRKVNPDRQIHMKLIKANGDLVASTEYAGEQVKFQIPVDSSFFSDKKSIYSEARDNMVYSIMKSDSNDWYYLMETPRDYYYKRIDALNRNVILASVAVFVTMFSVSMFVIFRWTSPFGDLLEIASRLKRPVDNRYKKTEMQLIVDAFSGLVETSNLQQQLLSGNQSLVRQSLLTQLLSGIKVSNDELEACINFLKMSLQYPFYTVVVLQFILPYSERPISILSNLEQYINRNNNFEAEFICYKFDEKLYSIIINHESIEVTEFKDFFSKLMDTFENNFMTVGFAAIGSTYESMENISKSYRSATDALCYAAYYPSINVLCYQETRLWDENTQIDEALIGKLMKNISMMHTDNICMYIKLMCDYIHNNFISYKTCMEIIEHIINEIETQVISMKIILNNEEKITLASQVENCYFITDMFDSIKNFVVKMFASVNKMAPSGVSIEYTNKAIAYLNENFYKDISVQDIADKVGVSRYHLSRIFKENTGITLIDYLNKLRFSKAEVFLKSTDMNINEVAKAVGFNNISYFNRKFKQMFGMTPSQFYEEMSS